MKPIRNRLLVIVFAFLAGSSLRAQANLILFDTYKTTPDNAANLITLASANFGLPGLQTLLRLDDLTMPAAGSPFSVNYVQPAGGNANSVANISWNFGGSGLDLLAVFVFGGGKGANLYLPTDTTQLGAGSATVAAPALGRSGKFARISSLLFVGTACRVPETSATAGLLAIAFSGLMLARRRWCA